MTPTRVIERGRSAHAQPAAWRVLFCVKVPDPMHTLTKFIRSVASIFADRFFPFLILGVVFAAYLAVFVMGADVSLGIGILVVGTITAFLETKERNKK